MMHSGARLKFSPQNLVRLIAQGEVNPEVEALRIQWSAYEVRFRVVTKAVELKLMVMWNGGYVLRFNMLMVSWSILNCSKSS